VSEDIAGCHGPSAAQPDAPECGAAEKSGCSARDDREEGECGGRADPPGSGEEESHVQPRHVGHPARGKRLA
jgi:hypothetical protein